MSKPLNLPTRSLLLCAALFASSVACSDAASPSDTAGSADTGSHDGGADGELLPPDGRDDDQDAETTGDTQGSADTDTTDEFDAETDIESNPDVEPDVEPDADTDTDVVATNLPPSIGSVELSDGLACEPVFCDVFDVVDDEGDPITLRYVWFVDDEEIAVRTDTLPADIVEPGQSVRCVVDATDGVPRNGEPEFSDPVSSDELLIEDEPPSGSVTTGGHVRRGELVSCEVEAYDDCNTRPDIDVSFTVNGEPRANSPVLDTSDLSVGDVIQCVARVDDGVNEPVSLSSATQEVLATTWSLNAWQVSGRAGYSVAVADDLDGDGLAEIAVGAPDTSFGSARQAGAVLMAFGRDNTTDTPLPRVDEEPSVDGFAVRGTSGGYDVETMGCTPYIVSECPRITTTGELDGEDTGPANAVAVATSISLSVPDRIPPASPTPISPATGL